ncbi:ATP-binding protein [Enterococcus cecorum]|nr:ATP-binding protein [Enterococcus cecorum]
MLTKKEKKYLQEIEQRGYDLAFLSEIQPQTGMYFEENQIVKGEGYETVLHIYAFPKSVNYFWLTDILNQPDMVSVIDVSTANKAEVLKQIASATREQADRAKNDRTYVERQDASFEVMDLQALSQSITQKSEVVKFIHARMYLSSDSVEKLQNRVSKLKKEFEGKGYRAGVYLGEQKDEWLALFHSYGEQQTFINRRRGQAIPANTIGAGYPFHHIELNDISGSYIGQTDTGGAVIFDLFLQNAIRKSYNAMIFGLMGNGKSTLLKVLEEDNYDRGNIIRGFSKGDEYDALIAYQNGVKIDLAGSQGLINPFEVFATRMIGETEIIDQVASFNQHINKLEMMFRFMNRQMKDIDLVILGRILNHFYIDLGLWVVPQKTADGRIILDSVKQITGLHPTAYPTMTDFVNYLEQADFVNQEIRPTHGKLVNDLMQIAKSMEIEYGNLFNGHTSIPNFTDKQVVFYDIDTIKSLKENLFHAQLFTALSSIWNEAVMNGVKMKRLYEEGKLSFNEVTRFLVLIDECQNVINAQNIFAVNYVKDFQKEMRKLFAGIIFATQSPREILPESATDLSTEAIKQVFELTQYKFNFKLDSSVIPLMKKVMGTSISESGFDELPRLKQGECILSIGANQSFKFKVDVTKEQLNRYRGGA